MANTIKLNSFRDVFKIWGEPKFGVTNNRIAADMGVDLPTAAQWRIRGRIPVKHWPRLITVAKAKHFSGISYSTLSMLHPSDVPDLPAKDRLHPIGKIRSLKAAKP